MTRLRIDRVLIPCAHIWEVSTNLMHEWLWCVHWIHILISQARLQVSLCGEITTLHVSLTLIHIKMHLIWCSGCSHWLRQTGLTGDIVLLICVRMDTDFWVTHTLLHCIT